MSQYHNDTGHSSTKDHLKANFSNYQWRLGLIENILVELAERSDNGEIILAEGKRDIISLKKLGIDGPIELVTQLPLSEISERVSSEKKRVIILTDWDRRGNILAAKLSEDLVYFGADVDMQLRDRLSSLVKKEIKDVESLYTYVIKLRKIVTGDQIDI
ncbi:toprim domain-containing protein [Methanococcoides sp. SA1]|nr:toprim domain-containing protein [Methanococcoides sp. SA1]